MHDHSTKEKKIGTAARIIREVSTEKYAEERFRLAVEACPSGTLMTDGGGTIVLANAEAERLFGYRRDELIGRPIDMLLPERLRDRHARHRQTFAERPRARRVEASRNLFGRRRDGTEFPAEIGLNPIRTRKGLFVLCVVIDVGERKRMDRLKDEFVSTVSHELRTPLTSIAGSLGLLLGGAAGTLPESAVRLLRIAHSNSQRLVRLINDILDIEKIESGQTVFNFKRVDVRALVEQVIEANRGYADGFGVRVRLEPASSAAEVHADPDRLAQVVTNLLSNAIKFSPRDAEVTVAIEPRGEFERVSVRDRGAGIPEAFKPRVFDKFAQADATDARQKGGTGLGLSIVKQIMARLGGNVGFDDAEGGGTVFHVDLPSWTTATSSALDREATPQAVRLLLCEDDPEAANTLREGLRPFGFATDFAHDPADAVARTTAKHYAAILLDLELPDAGGLSFVRRLRAQPEIYKTPIVIIAGARGAEKLETSKLDAIEWIDKPVDIDHLAQLLDDVLARSPNGRPRILHVDDDHDVLDLVAEKLASTANVISVDSAEEARRALLLHQFDLAVLDITLGPVSGLDLLPQLRSRKGTPIPVIVFSAHAAELAPDAQVEARLEKTRAALDELAVAVHDRLMLHSAPRQKETG